VVSVLSAPESDALARTSPLFTPLNITPTKLNS
jgi:hypothetical protein